MKKGRIGRPFYQWDDMVRFYFGILWCFLTMAGCGGGGAGLGDTKAPPRLPTEYEKLLSARALLDAQWAGASIFDPAGLPDTGGATYQGIANLTVAMDGSELSLAGKLTLSVNFADDAVTGSIYKVVDENEVLYSGTLVIDNGDLDRDADVLVDYTFTADIAGTLSGGGNLFEFDGDIGGDFVGDSAGAVSGAIQGLVTGAGGSGALLGSFLADI